MDKVPLVWVLQVDIALDHLVDVEDMDPCLEDVEDMDLYLVDEVDMVLHHEGGEDKDLLHLHHVDEEDKNLLHLHHEDVDLLF